MKCQCQSDHTKIYATGNVHCTRKVSDPYKTCYNCYSGHVNHETDNDPMNGTDENDLSRQYEAGEEAREHLQEDMQDVIAGGN